MSALKIPANARHIFVEFMAREGWHRRDAQQEFDDFLSAGNGVARTRDSYLTVRRTGSRVVLTRAQRTSIYETFINSINHATFEN